MIINDKPRIEIINADCLEYMRGMPDKSVDLTITSPPYDNLRKYEGYTFDFENIAKEIYRLTKDGGAVVWVVGDQTINGSETGTSFRQALHFQEIGFNLHDTMIYQKTGGGFPQQNRYTQSFEYMFIFSKRKLKTVNIIKDHKNRFTHRWSAKSSIRQKDGSLKDRKNRETKLKDFGARFNIWKITNGYGFGHTDEKLARQHPATFPEKLAKDHILSWSNEENVILDPMMGSGTTGKMSKILNRDFIGIEISEKYFNIAHQRINNTVTELFNT